jgi:hypothetical protein
VAGPIKFGSAIFFAKSANKCIMAAHTKDVNMNITNLDKISNQEIKYVYKVFVEQDFSIAASLLGVKYASLIQAILRFEKKLGIQSLFFKRQAGHGKSLTPNPEYTKLFEWVHDRYIYDQKLVQLFQKDDLSHMDFLISGSQTLLECFVLPIINAEMVQDSFFRVNIIESDDLSCNHPRRCAIAFVNQQLNDNKEYNYVPFHSFTQKLWASDKCINHYGGIESINDIIDKKVPILFQRCRDFEKNSKENYLIGHKKIFDFKTVDYMNVVGVRSVDLLSSYGLGIQISSEETTKIMKLPLVNICPDVEGEDIPIFIKYKKHCTQKEEDVILSTIEKVIERKNVLLQDLK